MTRTIIQGGTLVTASETFAADLAIEDRKIAEVGVNLETEDADVVDAAGKLIMPGGVDPHTHFDLPMFGTVSSDDHYTGHKAAAFGGTTTVIDFVPQGEGSLHQSIDLWHEKADGKAAIDFSFHMNITRLDEPTLKQIPGLIDDGITTLKVFTAYNGRLRLQDGEIFQVMRLGAQHGMLTMLHAENGDVIEIMTREALAAGHIQPEWHAKSRPSWGAVESVLRAIALAAQADSPLYIVHMNTAGGLDHLRTTRARGLPVMGETCPQYLFFTEEQLRRKDGSKWICSPPMRSEEDNQALWQGVSKGDFQVIGTDHCPFFYDGTSPIEYEGEEISIPGKELGQDDFTKIPNGLPAVGDRIPILWSYGVREKKITMNQFVALVSTNPAKIFGMYPKKGSLRPGADADLVIWDPEKKLTYGVEHAQHRTDYNLFESWALQGFPEKVYLRGQLIVEEEAWLGGAGMGEFVKRSPNARPI